jgi:hypothetical protein
LRHAQAAGSITINTLGYATLQVGAPTETMAAPAALLSISIGSRLAGGAA